MKRATFFLIAIVFFLQMTGAGVCAETTSLQPKEQSLTQLLTKSQDAGGLVPAIDPERLPEELPSVEGLPILVQFPYGCWNLAVEDDFYKAVQSFSQKAVIEYIVLSEEPVILCDNRDGAEYGVYTHNEIPDYLREILYQNTNQGFLGEVYTIQNILCVGSMFRPNGCNSPYVIVFYVTDGGIFVRYHEWNKSTLEYKLEDFQSHAKEYSTYLDYFEQNQRSKQKAAIKEGKGFLVGTPEHGFAYFMQDQEAAYENCTYRPTSTVPWTEQYPWAIPGICCVALVTLTPLVFLVIHTIRKKREYTNE